MEPSPGPRLLQQAEKILLHPIHPHLISYCPTMDLIALVTDEENLDVYRINGQKAFSLRRKSLDMSIDCVCWEFNGQAIAVSWSDGSADILSSETGKLLFKDIPSLETWTPPTIESGGTLRISCMGWGLNFIDVEAVKRRTGISKHSTNGATTTVDFGAPTTEEWDALKDGTTLEDFLQRQPDLQSLDVAPDLPDQLAMMDMETLLPKLPAIPMPPALPFQRATQTDSGAFSTQPQVDSLLHSHHMKDHNSVDMFIRCTNVGSVHPSIYDSLETVDIGLPSSWGIESKTLLHTSHPYSCTHGLLFSTKTETNILRKLAFVPLTLGFIPSAGIYLHLIASKTSQLQNLLLYIQQTLQRIRAFWKHSQDLPTKFMMNISETLEEKGLGTLVQNLYHLACTGTCSAIMKEWLIDELAEQGHKRWDHTVTSSLSALLSLIHENLLPALDRCSIAISRLSGLAQYHDQGWIFTEPVTNFTELLMNIKNLRLLAHTALLYAGDEKRQFASFSKWLRFSIDFEATEPDSQSRQEMEARDPGVDIAMVLEYIQYGLTKSDLGPYLKPSHQLAKGQRVGEAASYEDTRKAIDSLKEGGNFKEGALCIDHVYQFFSTGCARLFHQISSWQESSISMNSGIVLEESPSGTENTPLDMRMLFEPEQNKDVAMSTYIITTNTTQPSNLHIHRLTHATTITALPKDLDTYNATTLTFPPGSKPLDAKFADDQNLLVLLSQPPQDKQTDQTCTLLSIPYTTNHTSLPTKSPINPIPFTPLPPSTYQKLLLPHGHSTPASQRTTHPITQSQIEGYTKHVFERRFTPLKLVVNGREGRRVVVVLGSDCKHYRVLDLDFRARANEGMEGVEVGESSDEDGDVDMVGV